MGHRQNPMAWLVQQEGEYIHPSSLKQGSLCPFQDKTFQCFENKKAL
jgi:hypothetical protein